MGYTSESKDIKISDSILDFILSRGYKKYLVLLVVLGGILRYFLVKNISFLGDEMVHGPHAINILSSGKIGMLQESILWFYLTDIVYKILGVTAFSSRSLSFFFGILSIIALYLLVKEIFDEKVAIISSFLLAISPFIIRYTLVEMDIAMMFFVLMGLLFFIKGLKKNRISYESALFFGIAALIKSIALFFIIGCAVAYFYFKYTTSENKRKLLKEKDWKQGFSFGGIILLIYSPILIHNYLLYKSKGIVDVYFAQYFNINREQYSGLLGYDQGLSIINMITGSFNSLKNIALNLDPIVLFLGVIGILLIFRKKDILYQKIILIISIIPFLLQSGTNTLTTHYTNYIPILTIFAAFSLIRIEEQFKKYYKQILIIILVIIFIINIFLIPVEGPLINHFTSKSANIQMRDYTIENIEKEAVVLVDSRIYRGRIAWMFNDKNYLESTLFGGFNDMLDKLSGQNVQVPLYFIECVTDDCGWGTITEGPLNQSSEYITDLFKQNSQKVETLYGGGGYDEETNVPYFNIYKTQIIVKPGIYEYIESTHDWFYYPLRYQRDWYDSYKTEGVFEKFIDLIGYMILWITILISIIIPIYLFYLIKKDKMEERIHEEKGVGKKNVSRTYILLILLVLLLFGSLYIHNSNKTTMMEYCNSIGLELYKYKSGELYCLNKTDNRFRGFYYVSSVLNFNYKVTREMQLHGEWKSGLN